MAIFHLSVKPVSRGSGRTSTAAAAYRSASIIRDERTGETHDYRRKSGVVYSAIMTPDGSTIARGDLWNLAEASERRKDSRTAREYEIALPAELDQEGRQNLAEEFARHVMSKYGVAVDLCIHEPGKGDDRNHHAHIMTTTRRFEAGALGDKSEIEWEEKALKKAGLPKGKQQIEELRQAWEVMANRSLGMAGIDARIDSRSLDAQGISRAPTIHLGPAAAAMERRGEQTERGDINRMAAMTPAKVELDQFESLQAGIDQARAKAHQWKKNQEQRRRQEALERERQALEQERQQRLEQERQCQIEEERKRIEEQQRKKQRPTQQITPTRGGPSFSR